MTLGDMITDALRKAGVIRKDQSASPAQGNEAINTFNGMMAEYDADGVVLGDFPVTAIEDVLDIEREHEEAIRNIFAVRLAIDHGMPDDAKLIAVARLSEKFLLRNTMEKPDFSLEHVPLGRTGRGYNINNG